MRATPLILSAFFLLAALAMLSPTYAADAKSGDLNKKKIGALLEKALASPNETVRVIVKMKSAPAGKTRLLATGNTTNSSLIENSGALLNAKKIFKLGDSEFAAASLSLQELQALASDPRVESISEDRKMHAFLSQSVPLISANSVWAKQIEGLNITGAGTSVCIIDTGVDYTHPDLGGCTNETFLAGNCSKVIGGYDFVNSDNNPMDDNGHGTHVAGIVAANGALKGVAPGTNIVAIKVLNASGSGSESDVASGIGWCVANSTAFNISAISMSLGGDITYTAYCDSDGADNSLFAESINAAIAKNISVIVATGNRGVATGYSGVSSPACIQNATRVTATDKSDTYAPFAERGAGFPDILAAPGVGIASTYLNSGQRTMDGTSMATPHVSGAIALLSQAQRELYGISQTPQYFKILFNLTGLSKNDTSGAKINFSRINVLSAYNELVALTITISSPENGAFLNTNSTQITASQNFISWMNYSIDAGNNISACQNCNTFQNYSANLTDGLHNLTVYGNNSAVALANATIWFTIDTIPPIISFSGSSDANNSIIGRPWIFANLSVNESNFANATFFLFNSSVLINSTTITAIADESALSVNWTALPQGEYYFNATVIDKAGNSNSSQTWQATIDLSAPAIENISVFPPISYPGQNITISYLISDATPVNSTINITHGGVSELFNFSGSGNANYSSVFSNTSDAADYGVLVSAADSAGHESNAGAQFKIQPRANVSFNFANFSSGASLEIKIKYGGAEIANFSANSSEEKNILLGYEKYAVEAHGVNQSFVITLAGVNLSDGVVLAISFSNISANTSDSSKYRFTNNSFSFSPDFGRSSATVCLNYTAYASGFSNLSRAANFKCNGLCADNGWAAIATSVNPITNQSCSNISSFSSFVLGELLPYCGDGIIDAGETCSGCPVDTGACPAAPQAPAGGSSGYGGITAIKANATNMANISANKTNFTVPANNYLPDVSSAENKPSNRTVNLTNGPAIAPNVPEITIGAKKETNATDGKTPMGFIGFIFSESIDLAARAINYLMRILFGF